MAAQAARSTQTGIRRFGSGLDAALRHVLACEADGYLSELWHADFALPYRVDLHASGRDKALFVIILRLEGQPEPDQTDFVHRLAKLERTHFGPADFAPGGVLAGYLAIPATGTRQPEIEAWASDAFSRTIGHQATDVHLVQVLSVARARRQRPRLVTHTPPPIPPWRRTTTDNNEAQKTTPRGPAAATP